MSGTSASITEAAVPAAAARPARSASLSEHAWIGLWVALLVPPLVLRAPLPPDELRYLSVAWEMWSRGDLILPYLNGAPYDDKGPLLFWLMHAGWAVFGVNDWWPRLLPWLLALTAVIATRALCRTLWPANAAAARLVPWFVLGSFAVAIYTQVVMFDLLLTNATLLATLGIARAERGASSGWLVVAVATGLGLLSKGPAAFLHFAGAALLVPCWRRSASGFSVSGWYARVAVAVGGGLTLALVWAAAAIARGGASYGADILLHQTSGRLVESFAHARPFWFYLAVLPALLLPWSVWPAAWAAVRAHLRQGWPDEGWRLIAAAIVPSVVAFSAMSGKQPHYLLPAVPLCAALLSAALSERDSRRDSAYTPAVLMAAAAVGIAILPLVASLSVEPWSPTVGAVAAIVLVALGRGGAPAQVLKRASLLTPLFVISAETAFFSTNRLRYDASQAATLVRSLQDAGHSVAYTRDYEGELHFEGRLTAPLEIIGSTDADVAIWSQQHPDGYVIRYGEAPRPGATYTQRFRGDWLSVERAQP